MASDERFMREALALARKGLGKTSPNPAVGCVLVKDGAIIGRGYHERAGEAHAEVNALEEAGKNAQGSTMYVTLEPCCHHGRTPPCTEAIIEAGVKRVVAAMEDPNPRVSGRGLAELKRAGVHVESGVLEGEARAMNEMYEKFVRTKEPFVLVKAALSADGKMAANDGSSKWITGEKSREIVHELRAQVDAVMVGINTVLKDDPELTCRLLDGKDPKRIIVDSRLRMPSDAKILKGGRTIIATTDDAPMGKIGFLRGRGVEVLVLSKGNGGVNLRELMKELASIGIASVMIEGGGGLIGSAFDAGIVDKIAFFIAPKIIGGQGVSIGGAGIESIAQSMHLEKFEIVKVGEDFMLLGYPVR